MRRIVLIAGALLLLLSGCALHTPSAEPPAPSATAVVVPNVVGQAGNDAQKAIIAAGLIVKWDAGAETVILAGNWTVQSQDPAAGAASAAGATVTLTVTRATATPVPGSASTTGLTEGGAIVACDEYADQAFPYGYNPAHILGVIVSAAQGPDWHTIYTAKVKNAFNAERQITIDCTVAGTDDAATVTVFNAG